MSFEQCSICRSRQYLCFPQNLSFKFLYLIIGCFVNSSGVTIRFKSFTYTTIIINPISDFLMKTHGQIRLFTYPDFHKYSLKWSYYTSLDCFNPYIDLCSLIEYIFQDFELVASGNLNPSGIFICQYLETHIDKL